ncbi:hypothetical protein SCHPADRAFT_460131 [Schizopora paradoxa]|uniref:Uncharacterized protein n=1 Tax=Schizopora paradoxa TaxID=27342 RepID=A0A0H2RIA7_9AGAM|nr:hypothetical protein SCHPADRAFT_460131 [Schizopora paradoxa]
MAIASNIRDSKEENAADKKLERETWVLKKKQELEVAQKAMEKLSKTKADFRDEAAKDKDGDSLDSEKEESDEGWREGLTEEQKKILYHLEIDAIFAEEEWKIIRREIDFQAAVAELDDDESWMENMHNLDLEDENEKFELSTPESQREPQPESSESSLSATDLATISLIKRAKLLIRDGDKTIAKAEERKRESDRRFEELKSGFDEVGKNLKMQGRAMDALAAALGVPKEREVLSEEERTTTLCEDIRARRQDFAGSCCRSAHPRYTGNHFMPCLIF